MPELPEVETVRLQLRRKVAGKTIREVEVFHDKTMVAEGLEVDILRDKTIKDIDRVGKLLIFSFVETDDLFLLAHLKMTGQFFFVDRTGSLSGGGHTMTEADSELPHKHTRVAYYFTDNSVLYFNDMRLFGYNKLASRQETEQARARFGPEPIAEDFDCEWFGERLRTRNTPVKAALLDQAFVAGLGNIYVDEALFKAGVRPMRKANLVTKKEAAALCAAAGDVMRAAITVGGTTFQHFSDTGGDNGNYTDYLQVFGRQGQTCYRCGDTIKKTRCAGRGTHYCPGCQK